MAGPASAAFSFGVVNEFVQAGVPGRDYSYMDMTVNGFGALTAIIILLKFGHWKIFKFAGLRVGRTNAKNPTTR